jgi:hypothetical protein
MRTATSEFDVPVANLLRLTENRARLICNERSCQAHCLAVVDLFRSRAAIEAEILALRQQIIVLRRTAPKKQTFGAIDRLVFVGLYRLLSARTAPSTSSGK